MQSSPLYIAYLFSMYLNENFVEIEKPDQMCLTIFLVHNLLRLYLHPTIFYIKNSKSV